MGDELTPLTFGSLFAGIGGFDLGLEAAGMVCKWQVEKDPFCLKVLAKHWPNVTRIGDIHHAGKHNLESIDLICGGFPCQPFSVAGGKRGQEDDRYLWPEMLRVIRELGPRWVIGENVAGFISMELSNALIDLETEGYQVEPPLVLPAYGVGGFHERERVWIVAYASSQRQHESASEGNTLRSGGAARLESKVGTLGRCQLAAGKTMAFERSVRQQWPPEPPVCRVANGIPGQVDRLRGLGNAVVPQIVEIIGRAIIEIDKYE